MTSTSPRLLVAIALVTLLGTPTLRADNWLAAGRARATRGERGLRIPITAKHDMAIHGYSVAIRYPAEALELESIGIEGTHVSASAPEFIAPRIDNDQGVATLGVILNFSESPAVSELEPHEEDETASVVARLVFAVRPNAPAGTHAIELVDGIGQPAAYNVFTSRGRTVAPGLRHGSIRVESDNVLALDRSIAVPGATPSLRMFAYGQHPDALAGLSIAVLYGCDALTLAEASTNGTDLAALMGARGIEFFQTDVDATLGDGDCRSRTGIIFDYAPPFDGQTLPPSPDTPYDQSLLRYRFTVHAAAGAEREWTDILLDNREAPGSLNNVFVVGTSSVLPDLIHGKVYFSLGCVTGRVLEAVSGDPVRGARIVTMPEGFVATTDASGRFAFRDIIPGVYSVTVSADGHYSQIVDDLLVTGGSGTQDCDAWPSLSIYRVPASGASFRRGYVNPDERLDVSDAVWLLNWLFKGGEPPSCLRAANVNGDTRIDISDTIWLLNWLFAGGPPPPAPFEECSGSDDSFACELALGCR